MDPIGRREAVRRSLFGPVDHDQLRRDLALQLREIAERDSRRWNFNFQAETPLSGRFQWEEIPADCAAAVYRERAEPRDDDRLSDRGDSPGTDRGDCPGTDRGDCPGTDRGDCPGTDRVDSPGTDQENRSGVFNARKRPADATPVRRRKRTLSKPAAKAGSLSRITDFFAKRRRTTETKSIPNPSHSEAASCRTIR